MATPLAYTAHYSHSAAAVRAALVEERYWKDRIAEVGGPGARLDSFTHSSDQLRVEMVQSIPAAELPSAITAVRPGDLIIPRIEIYSADLGSGAFEAHVEGAPAQVRGTVTLTDNGAGSRAAVTGSVEVSVPLFGKKIEAVVAEKLLELLAGEADFTNIWITNRCI
jgi:hypothetical protein